MVHRLPIGDRSIAPPLRFGLLNDKELQGIVIALAVDVGPQRTPRLDHRGDRRDAMVVMPDQRFPQRSAGLHPEAPRHVVEPQQIALVDRACVGPLRRDRRCVLRERVAAARRTVEADPLPVGPAVIARVPLRPLEIADPGPRAIVVVGRHLVREAERGHVIDRRLAAFEHDRHHARQKFRVAAEGLRHPFARDLLRRQRRVPRQAPERIPVRLVEMAARPVAVRAGVGDPRHAGRERLRHRAVPGAGVERFLPQRREEHEVGREAEVFLGDLPFEHQAGVRHRAEQRVERLARLEVDRAVLNLDDHVRGELPVERREIVVSLLRAVGRVLVRIDERAPDHHAAVADRFRHHVRAVGMGTAIVAGPGLAFGVGFHQKAAEIGDRGIDCVRLGLPPRLHGRIERVGGLEPAELDRRAEPCGEVHADAVGSPSVGQPLQLGDVALREHVRRGVDVVHHHAVDAERGLRAGIIDHPAVEIARQPPPVEDRAAGITAFDEPGRVVPMVDHAQRKPGRRSDIEMRDRVALPQLAQQREAAVEQAVIVVRDDRHASVRQGEQAIAAGGLIPERCPPHGLTGRQSLAPREHQPRPSCHCAEHRREPAGQLVPRNIDRRRVGREQLHGAQMSGRFACPIRRKRGIAEP